MVATSIMELRCVQSPTVLSTIIPNKSSFLSNGLVSKRINCPNNVPRNKRTIKLIHLTTTTLPPSGTSRIKSQAQVASTSDASAKDADLVFVAGATGKVGSRTVSELLKLGFKVRAGVRSTKRAESLVQSVRNIKLEDVAGGTQPIDKLELVECDLEKRYQIASALGNSSIVICCIGASEKEIFDVTGPYRIDYQATKNLIDAATSAKVDHFILLTSLGTNKVGFPAAILNLFWGVLVWKRKAEEALLASRLPYTIVRPGGMERPTDSYKETHNITLSEEDTLFGGQVSNLQVAELIAVMAKNRSLSCCKVVEVIAETSAPLTPMEELLKRIPSGREGICPPKESVAASKPQPVSEVTYVEKEPEQTKPTVATPLSPYAAYEDLKPPTSPTPTPSTGSGATKSRDIEVVPNATSSISSTTEANIVEKVAVSVENVISEGAPKKQNPLSPYANYEDLKPPTSPTPTPSTGSGTTKATKIDVTPNETTSVSSPVEVNSSETPTITVEDVTPKIAPKKQNPLSPYANYEDLKPPTSPTPTPSGSRKEPSVVYEDLKPPSLLSPTIPTISDNGKPDLPVDEKAESIAQHTEPKVTPLSPYTMYEDLKPPSSPTPRKL